MKEISPFSPSGFGIHKDSHTISKVMKPKIRIIHIFAPEIIKTDVENFRELVQRLTGKPSPADKRPPRKQKQQQNKKAEKIVEIRHQVKEEQEMWSNSGGYLAGFSDLDGFIKELDDFSMINPFGSSANHFHAFGDTQIA